jgi:hypothetical protein
MLDLPARANVPVRGVAEAHRRSGPVRDKVRAPNDRARCRSCRIFFSVGLADLDHDTRLLTMRLPKTITEIRSLARGHTRTALKCVLWDTILGLGTTPALKGDVSIWAGLVMSFYFGKRTFENVARIIKR